MNNAEVKLATESLAPAGRRAFGYAHLWSFLACWFPLNPFVLHYFSQFFRSNFSVTVSNWFAFLGMLASTVCGPFTAMLEGRNRDFCLRVALQLLPVCLGALAVAVVVQILWRPRSASGRAIRLLVWVIGCFIWFAGALISVFSNSG